MGQSVEREVYWEPPLPQLNEDLPHATTGGIVWEWEVDRSIEELLEVFLASLMHLI